MNPNELLNEATHAIEDRPNIPSTHWLVCLHEGKIKCLPISCRQLPEYTFKIITNTEAAEGLTTAEWGHLILRMANFFERKKT